MGYRKLTTIFLAFLLVLTFPKNAFSITVAERQAELEKELASLEQEINNQKKILSDRQNERASLERDIAIINAKIQTIKLSIKASDINISRLSSEIKNKEGIIVELSEDIDKQKESLSELMRKTDEFDSKNFLQTVITESSLSEAAADLDAYNYIKDSIKKSYEQIENAKTKTEAQKNNLEDRRDEEMNLKKLQSLQKSRAESEQAEKDKLLKITKGLESEYQKIIKDKEKNAASIRSELFTLRGSKSITFEKALELAKLAQQKTGIRPAFLLGIIAEESNLGANVGTGNWKTDMSPRDRTVFADLTARLGYNPDTMPVSKKAWYGSYGGAIGPAQFLPSTWIMYESRIASITGHNPPNPWDPGDAFMASAMLLKDNGAIYGNYSAERLAALRYLAGWKNATRKAYAFYGDDVMGLAEKYQRQIDILGQ